MNPSAVTRADMPPSAAALIPAVERHRDGRARRKVVARRDLADVAVSDPATAVQVLADQDEGRQPDLMEERYARLLQSPFSFLRGSAAVMAADLAAGPHTGLEAQLCGDAHLANFGAFATPERRLVFDLNDFDETLRGPIEWDLKRLVTSVSLVGRENGHSLGERERALAATAAAYRSAMRGFCDEPTLTVWYRGLGIDALMAEMSERMGAHERRATTRTLRRALTKDAARTVRKLTTVKDGQRQFLSRPPSLIRLADLHPEATDDELWHGAREVYAGYLASLRDDRRRLLELYAPVDLARKAVGVGSYGREAYVVLLQGPAPDDVIILQVKQAGPSVLEAYLGPSGFEHAGERVVSGQRRIQSASDALLGWQRRRDPEGRVTDYYVRQLRDGKLGAELETMDPDRLAVHAQLCAWTLARAHARSGDRFAIAGYLGKKPHVDEALTQFAEDYADRVEAQLDAVRAAREWVPGGEPGAG